MYSGSTVATTVLEFDTWLLPARRTQPSMLTYQSPEEFEDTLEGAWPAFIHTTFAGSYAEVSG